MNIATSAIRITLNRYVGGNTISRIALCGPDGKVILSKDAVIEGFDWDPETSRATFQVDQVTAIVCTVELVVSPTLVVHACI